MGTHRRSYTFGGRREDGFGSPNRARQTGLMLGRPWDLLEANVWALEPNGSQGFGEC